MRRRDETPTSSRLGSTASPGPAIAFVPIVIGLELALSAAEGATASRLRSRLLSCLPYFVVLLAYLSIRHAVVSAVEDRGVGPGTFSWGAPQATSS